uniref:Uncharacterized protein n=1 Tax=Homo sapiens TaxID=9606 RepID=Q2PUK0_HUMAN|nr:unknown [Homo sapiens]
MLVLFLFLHLGLGSMRIQFVKNLSRALIMYVLFCM